MGIKLLHKGLLHHAKKKKRWILVLGALGITGYGAYKAYSSPSLVKKRQRLIKLFAAFFSILETVPDSSDAIEILSEDVKEFLKTDCNEIPQSLIQVSKLARSDEFSQSLTRITMALTMGIIQRYRITGKYREVDRDFACEIIDKLFSKAGSGFASVVVGNFARNFALALLDRENADYFDFDYVSKKIIEFACGDECRELIGDCIRLFGSTDVTIYLNKTMKINTYDEIFSGLTNPEHEAQAKDMIISVCNNAVETLIQTSHQTWTKPITVSNPDASKTGYEDSFHRHGNGTVQDFGWASEVPSTLAVPCNRDFVLHVTGTVTFEKVKSFLDVLFLKLSENTKRRVNAVQREMVDKGVEP